MEGCHSPRPRRRPAAAVLTGVTGRPDGSRPRLDPGARHAVPSCATRAAAAPSPRPLMFLNGHQDPAHAPRVCLTLRHWRRSRRTARWAAQALRPAPRPRRCFSPAQTSLVRLSPEFPARSLQGLPAEGAPGSRAGGPASASGGPAERLRSLVLAPSSEMLCRDRLATQEGACACHGVHPAGVPRD